MKWRETSRGDLTDKLRGMIVKRIKEARRRGRPRATLESTRPALWDRMCVPSNHLFYINHTQAGRKGDRALRGLAESFGRRGAKRERYGRRFVFVRFSNVVQKKRVVMHVISRDAASGCPLCDPRRKPPSWKTCMWIDRFLYAIVAIVMPVALYKSFFCHALPFVDQRLSKTEKERERKKKRRCALFFSL